MAKKSIFVLSIWGNVYAFYSTKRAAVAAGRKINEPTSQGEKYDYAEFSVEKWIEGEDTQHADAWEYEEKTLIEDEND